MMFILFCVRSMYVCILYIWIYIVCMSGFDLIHTYSSDAMAHGILKSFFCLHKCPHAVTEVRACDTESLAIVGTARYTFTQLANHILYVGFD